MILLAIAGRRIEVLGLRRRTRCGFAVPPALRAERESLESGGAGDTIFTSFGVD